MEINLLVFTSSLSTEESVFVDHKVILDRISECFSKVNFYFPEDLDQCDFSLPTMFFVASGGVEEAVSTMLMGGVSKDLPHYIVLIADGLKNSLAASLEILSWLRGQGRQGRVIHGDTDYIINSMEDYGSALEAKRRLQGQRIGVIGKPSGWLIASGVDYTHVHDRWGITLVDLPLEELVENYNNVLSDESSMQEVELLSKEFIYNSSSMCLQETNSAEVDKAMRLYLALRRMVEKYSLNALTLNCFDLIPAIRTTGCVALALLNDQGVPSGCEGDIQTILTMVAVRAALNASSFMANPSTILDVEKHIMILVHCTIAPSMCCSYKIRSHFESQSGVAIEGVIPSGQELTIVKLGGRDMERSFISRARLMECLSNPIMCRTQLKIHLDLSPEYFLKESIGNHHVVVLGDHVRRLQALVDLLNQPC